MEPLTPLGWIIAMILIAVIAGVIGKDMTKSNSVHVDSCRERREACSSLVLEKFKSVEDRLDIILRILQSGLKVELPDLHKKE